MTPFQIRWQFTKLPNPSPQLTEKTLERIKRMYFEDAGRRWGYIVRGWPASSDNAALRLPGGQPFTYLEIEVVFEKFATRNAAAVGRVPAASIQRLQATSQQQQLFPYRAAIHVDLDDLTALLADRARFFDTILHEIGHVLGLGTSWRGQIGPDLVSQRNGGDVYTGPAGCRQFALAKGLSYGTPIQIPLDKEVVGTTVGYHWNEKALRFDIMSTELDMAQAGNQRGVTASSNVISRISAAALQDLGYLVDMRAAQPLPGG